MRLPKKPRAVFIYGCRVSVVVRLKQNGCREEGLHGVEWCSWECTVTNNDTKTHTRTHTLLSMCWKSIPRSIAHLILISYAMYDFSSLNPYFNTVISAREYIFDVIYFAIIMIIKRRWLYLNEDGYKRRD